MSQIVDFFRQHGFVFEIIISNFIYAVHLKRRNLFPLRLGAGIALLFLIKILWSLLPDHHQSWNIILYTTLFLLGMFLLRFCFEVSMTRALFCSIGAYATQHFAFRLSMLLQLASKSLEINIRGIDEMIYAAVSAAVYITFYFAFARTIQKNEDDFFQNREVIVLCIALLLFTTTFEAFIEISSVGTYLILAAYDFMCCFFTLYTQKGIFKSGKREHEFKMMEQIWHMQKKQYELSKENIDLINIKCHDLKHQLSLLGNRISAEEIAELDRIITIYDQSVKTGNEILDVVLAEKSLYCENYNIKLNCIADGKSLNFMRQSDLYSLLGNAIDNAIEAVKKFDNKDKRIISLTIKETMGMVSMHFENYFSGDLSFGNELPLTTKEDTRYHGFGMKSMKLITEKYNGTMSVKTDGDVFNLNLLFPIQPPEGYAG